MNLLHNPAVLKLVAAVILMAFFMLMGMLVIRQMRKELAQANQPSPARVSENPTAFVTAAYDGVIRKLKEQELELEKLRRSERERASESASTSEAVLSNLGSGVLLFNTSSLVKQANPAARSLFGYASPSGLHARDIFRGITATRMENHAVPEAIAHSLSGGALLVKAVELCGKNGISFRRLEADYRTPGGEQRVLGITLSPVKGPGDEPMGTACLASDLTEITRLAALMRLRESMAALGEMSAGIAHEFKNSLATISGYAQMLQRPDEPETIGEFAAKIASETSSLSRIVTDFLNFARPQGLARENIDLRELLEDCALESKVELDAKHVPLETAVIGDPTALRQAFSNLFRNSAEAVSGGRTPLVQASAQKSDNQLRLKLKDNGNGIPEELLSKIFIPFFTTKSHGTGLGLALVHRIIVEHGGVISAESGPEGSTFTLSFPAENWPSAGGNSG